mmetsp:Transcript_20661/g.65381  ORF Transcript_20661/g.65381 Transcript_20661/m.65381 type:complete len:203 (-) Transcript_20661:184-792(-)
MGKAGLLIFPHRLTHGACRTPPEPVLVAVLAHDHISAHHDAVAPRARCAENELDVPAGVAHEGGRAPLVEIPELHQQLLEAPLLGHLVDLPDAAEVVVPHEDPGHGGRHPLHARLELLPEGGVHRDVLLVHLRPQVQENLPHPRAVLVCLADRANRGHVDGDNVPLPLGGGPQLALHFLDLVLRMLVDGHCLLHLPVCLKFC